MFWWGAGDDISVTLINAALLALWPALPILLLGYIRQWLVIRRIQPKFALRKSETAELDRAVLLYEQVKSRITEISDQHAQPAGFWRAVFGGTVDAPEYETDELEDLEAYAQHLRAMIARLSSRPLQRLRSWVHVRSSQFALGRALAAHVVGLALLIVLFHVFEQSAWAGEFAAGAKKGLVWYPLDERIFYANAVATGFAALAAPLFYLMQWSALGREYSLEFSAFKDLAHTGVAQSVAQTQSAEPADEPSQDAGASEASGEGDWGGVLGLSRSATIEEVKEAYKLLIKQNHPDRVHGMSAAFKMLAESETKKINAAYRQALLAAASP
jgi:DnaJ domain